MFRTFKKSLTYCIINFSNNEYMLIHINSPFFVNDWRANTPWPDEDHDNLKYVVVYEENVVFGVAFHAQFSRKTKLPIQAYYDQERTTYEHVSNIMHAIGGTLSVECTPLRKAAIIPEYCMLLNKIAECNERDEEMYLELCGTSLYSCGAKVDCGTHAYLLTVVDKFLSQSAEEVSDSSAVIVPTSVIDSDEDEEAYWVGSNATVPERLYFTKQEAMSGEYEYIDAFNKAGMPVQAYKLLQDERAGVNTYTTKF